MDPFCGYGTTICAAQELNRRWIGIDIATHAVLGTVNARLKGEYQLTEETDYRLSGIPKTYGEYSAHVVALSCKGA